MSSNPNDSSSSDEGVEDHVDVVQELELLLESLEVSDGGKYTPVIIERMRNLEILLPFDIPDIHRVEYRFDRPPTKSVKERLESLGVDIKRGYFDECEDNILRKNWNSFSEIYHFDDPSLFFTLKYLQERQKAKFLQYLGNGLDNRLLYSINYRFKNLYEDKSRGRFTIHEDRLIKLYMETVSTQKYKELAAILGRDRMSIFRRCKLLQQSGELPAKIQWNYKLVEKMVGHLVTVCGVDHVRELRGHLCIPTRFWNNVAILMGLPSERLRKFWRRKLYTQIFAEGPIRRNETVIRLIKYMKMYKIKYWQHIKWNKVAKSFDKGMTGDFLLILAWNTVRSKVPQKYWRKVKAIVKTLNPRIPLIQCRPDLRLQRIMFDDEGKIHLIADEETEETNEC